MSLVTPEKIRQLQKKLYVKAKQEVATRCLREARAGFPTRSFLGLADFSDSMW